MKIYHLLKWNNYLYRNAYKLYYENHEKKDCASESIVNFEVLGFVIYNSSFDFCYKKNVLPRNIHLDQIVSVPFVSDLFFIYSEVEVLFASLAIFIFIFSRLYQNSLQAYLNDERFACEFHYCIHRYRDFINKTTAYLRDNGIYQPLPESHKSLIHEKYLTRIDRICTRAQQTLSELIRDPSCYIVIKLLKENTDPLIMTLVHMKAYPDKYPNDYLTDILLHNREHENPSNLFQWILSKFYRINKDKQKDNDGAVNSCLFDTWDLGFLANDFSCEKHFDVNLCRGKLTKYKGGIIVPITVEYKIIGFYVF